MSYPAALAEVERDAVGNASWRPFQLAVVLLKLAQLPWYGFAGMLFGRVGQRCPRHGYRHPDLDARIGCGSRRVGTGSLPPVHSEPAIRLRPPDLIIQDELHLISGALGLGRSRPA